MQLCQAEGDKAIPCPLETQKSHVRNKQVRDRDYAAPSKGMREWTVLEWAAKLCSD